MAKTKITSEFAVTNGELTGLMTLRTNQLQEKVNELKNLFAANKCSDFESAFANHKEFKDDSPEFLNSRDQIINELLCLVYSLDELRDRQAKLRG